MKPLTKLVSYVAFCLGIAGIGIVVPTATGWATIINLDFDSLPSAQGWYYQGPSETSIFSVDGTKLTQDTVGTGMVSAVYAINDAIDPLLPFAVSVQARIVQYEGPGIGGFAFVAFTGEEIFQVCFDANTISLNGVHLSFDNTQFHVYRMEAIPGVGFNFFIDNVLFWAGPPAPSSVHNHLLFGDGNGGDNTNALVEITSFAFTQPSEVPPYNPEVDGFHFRNWGLPVGPYSIYGHCLAMSYASLYYWFLDYDPIPDQSLPPLSEPQILYIEWLQINYIILSAIQNIFWTLHNAWKGSESIATNYVALKAYIDLTNMAVPIGLAKGVGTGAHAVLVYKIDDTPNQKILHVYDSNLPQPEFRWVDPDPSIVINVENNLWEVEPYSPGNIYYDGYTRFAMMIPPFDPVDLPMAIILHSSASMLVSDPEGNTISPGINEIEGARYWWEDIDDDGEEEQIVGFAAPKGSQYSIAVLPHPGADPNDVYSLEVLNYGKNTHLAEDVKISEIPTEPYIYSAESSAPVPATIDIDPNTLNLKSKGKFVTCYIELPEAYHVDQIDINTVTVSIGGTTIPATLSPTEINDYDNDSIPDLMLKFDRQQIQDGPNVGSVEMIVNGSLIDGNHFQGMDSVEVINKSK